MQEVRYISRVQVVRAGVALEVAVEGYGGKVMLFESSSGLGIELLV